MTCHPDSGCGLDSPGGPPNPLVLPQGAASASLARGEPRPAPQLRPRPCPRCRALLPTRWFWAGEPLAAAWGCLTARPHGSQSQSPEAAPCVPCDLRGGMGLVLGPGRGRTPGLATNTLTDAAAPRLPGGPSAQHRFPACREREPPWQRAVPSRARSRNDVCGRRPRAGRR